MHSRGRKIGVPLTTVGGWRKPKPERYFAAMFMTPGNASGRTLRGASAVHPFARQSPPSFPAIPLQKTVFHLIETCGPGGAETVFIGLIRGLDRSRWRSIAVVPPRQLGVANSGWLIDALKTSEIETVILDESHSFDVRSFARLVGIVRAKRGALVHAHLFGGAVRTAVLSRLLAIPGITTLHGHGDIAPDERHLRVKLALVNTLARIVFVSEPLRQSFVETRGLREDRTMVIPNGIDAAEYVGVDGAAFRRELGIDPGDFVVGSVGNLTPAKSIDVLVQAAAVLKARSPGYRFIVVGDLKGAQGEMLMALRDSLGLREDFHFAGFRSDIPGAMAAFDLYALTSRSEGFSIALVEAMASGLPVVATRCGGPEQIVDNEVTGVLIEPGDPSAVASAIERLRSSLSERLRLGTAARAAAQRSYSHEAHVAAYERVYDEVTNGGRGES